MSRTAWLIVWGSLLLGAGVSHGEAQPAPGDAPAANDSETAKKERLAFMREVFATYALAAPGAGERTFTRSEEPLVRYSNPVRFVMKETATTDQTELRLMSQPIYRFAADKSGIIDGALFAFAEGTDPEALLLLEAVRGAGESLAWRYTLARMTSRPIEVKVDDRSIWSAEGYWANPRSPSDPYVEIIRGLYPAAP